MNVRDVLEDVRAGRTTVEEAEMVLRSRPFVDLGYARIDTHRRIRQGAPEVIYGAGKTPEQCAGIARALMDEGSGCVLITRCSPEARDAVVAAGLKVDYSDIARTCVVGDRPEPRGSGYVCIVTAGTSDIPVAEEAAVTVEAMGSRAVRLFDVGVAGIHRLLSSSDKIMGANAVVAVAGMEGALPSVIGGMADAPVIAVPTSVGYGSSFEGLAALLSMMNSCASTVSVVNIDNGFGAGYIAAMIDRRTSR